MEDNSFTILKNSIITSNISNTAFRVYSYLQSKCYGNKNSCFPAQKTIAISLHMSVRSVQRALKELVQAGIIRSFRRGSTSNLYVLLKNIVKKSVAIVEPNVKKVADTIRKVKNSFYSSKKTSTFNNFKPRSYNFKNLEKMLLGEKDYNPEKLIE